MKKKLIGQRYFSDSDRHSHYHHHLLKFLFSKFKYPKITLYAVFILLAYFFFTSEYFSEYVPFFVNHGYWSIFLAGLLFSYGFTTPFSIGIFLLSDPSNIILASLIAGFGAFIADSFILAFIRFNMMDEFKHLQKTASLKSVESFFHKYVNVRLQKIILYFFAGFIIASPLPDEFGVALLAGLSKAHSGIFAFVSFIFNTLGIFVMLFFF
jgi:hypothetical protein